MSVVEIYGDSILKGVTYAADQRRYRLCRRERLEALTDEGIALVNRSHMGATVQKGLSLLERRDPFDGDDSLVILEYGGNDCDFDWQRVSDDPVAPHLPHTPEAEFLAQYRKSVELARSKGARVALLSLIPIDADRYFRFITAGRNADNILHWLGDVNMLSRWQEHYNHLVERAAVEWGCPLIDIRQDFLLSHRFSHLISEDGIHPTQEGHDLIADRVAGFLTNFYRIL